MKLLIFLHGTTIMHRNAVGRAREERVRQSREREASVLDYAAYVPIGRAVQKLASWERQGAEILYLSSHRKLEDVVHDQAVLDRFDFPAGPVLHRMATERYPDVVERAMPDVLIEDDCESIGGADKMITPHLKPELRARITVLVVPEFAGIDHLPDALDDLHHVRA